MTLHLRAPAKLNLTFEVMRRREDGYHEVASIMQTIDLTDRITLSPEAGIELVVSGPQAAGLPDDPAQNLAHRAAEALRHATGASDGVRIELEKRIPGAAGLGGGSSDAAAVLRGLDRLWRLDLPLAKLEAIAAGLGSDVPFFLHGGTVLATGRGEVINPLPALQPQQWTLFVASSLGDKTRSMYGALRPEDFSDGALTTIAAQAIEATRTLPAAGMRNAFDRAVAEVFLSTGTAMALCRDAGAPVVVAGAGPSFFSPTAISDIPAGVLRVLETEYGITGVAVRTLSAEDALTISEG